MGRTCILWVEVGIKPSSSEVAIHHDTLHYTRVLNVLPMSEWIVRVYILRFIGLYSKLPLGMNEKD